MIEYSFFKYLEDKGEISIGEIFNNPPIGLFNNKHEIDIFIQEMIYKGAIDEVDATTIKINNVGLGFINNYEKSEEKEKRKEFIEEKLMVNNILAAESVVKTNKYTLLNIIATIIFAFIVTMLQVVSYIEDKQKDALQLQKEKIQIQEQRKSKVSDSIFQNKVILLIQGRIDSLKN